MMVFVPLFMLFHLIPVAPVANTQIYLSQLQQSAASGTIQAQICLGEMEQFGIKGGGMPNYSEAFKLYQRASDEDNLVAKEHIGQLYMNGWGDFRPNRAKAMKILRALFKQGYSPAAADIGMYYLQGYDDTKPDFQEAVYWFKQGAEGDDPFSEVALARMYRTGLGVSRNLSAAREWLAKAANHRIGCIVTFLVLSEDIIEANMNWPADAQADKGLFVVLYKYEGGRAVSPHVVRKSDKSDLDAAWLNAIKESKLPPWPEKYSFGNRHVGFLAATALRLLWGEIRFSIHRALVFPKDVVVYGAKGKGVATVEFDYLDGTVTNVRIQDSSGDPSEDAAALRAVRTAHYQPTVSQFIGIKEHIVMPVSFEIEISNSLGIGEAAARHLFESGVRSAIQHALVFPKHVIVYGAKGNGIATVEFDYLDGKVMNVKIKTSSGDSSQDMAALQAVKTAHYLLTPANYIGVKKHFIISLRFIIKDKSTDVPATNAANHR